MADTIKIPDVGLIALTARCVEVAPTALYMDLYTNQVAYSGFADHVASSFTLMSSATDNASYVQKTLAVDTWGTPTVITLQGVSVYGEDIVWSFADHVSVDVWGYIVRDASAVDAGNVLWACYFESAKPIAYSSETITVTPTFKFGQVA